jgi:hypothetical protein
MILDLSQVAYPVRVPARTAAVPAIIDSFADKQQLIPDGPRWVAPASASLPVPADEWASATHGN